MKKIIQYIQKSLSTKLSLWIVLFATLIFLSTLGGMFIQSRKAVREEAISRAEQVLNTTVMRANAILGRVIVATDNMDWLIYRHLDTPDSMFVYSKRMIENNPYLEGCAISFEPYFFKDRGKYFSAFSLNDDDSIPTAQQGSEYYEYFTFDWYQMCKLLDHPCWTDPYFDYNPECIYSEDMIASYCKPLKDRNGIYIGTISVDLSLSKLSQTFSAVKPYPHSYCIMTGRGGTYYVHPDSTKLFYQTIFTETLEKEDTAIVALGHAMQHGESGIRKMKIDGEDCHVLYSPLSNTGLSIAIVCSEKDIFSSYNNMERIVIIVAILGLLLMLFACSRIVKQELKPLGQLTQQAETIASGNFNESIPQDGRIDEVGRLCQSFSHMQSSLVDYIEQTKQSTAAKAAIENELKVASDIQMSMVPRIFPPFPNRKDIDLYATMTPAKEVGGDLYDFFIQNETLYFCIGDVSGKGVPASLFMAVTRNLFRVIAQQDKKPEEIATDINRAVSRDNDQCMFVTMFIGKLNLQTGHMQFCNCGHNPPVIVSPGEKAEFINIKYKNQPLGLMENIPFHGESIDDIKGKNLLLYTDGLNEAENTEQELFGNDALLKMMTEISDLNSTEITLKLKDAVEMHRNGAAPNDDLTILCLKFKG